MQVVAAFKILTSDPQVKALLVNIFGAALPLRHTWTPQHPKIQRAWCPHAQQPIPAGCGSSFLTRKVMNRADSRKIACKQSGLMLGACGCAGGIMKCDVIAAGIVSAAKEVRPSPPCCVVYIFMTARQTTATLACTFPNASSLTLRRS